MWKTLLLLAVVSLGFYKVVMHHQQPHPPRKKAATNENKHLKGLEQILS